MDETIFIQIQEGVYQSRGGGFRYEVRILGRRRAVLTVYLRDALLHRDELNLTSYAARKRFAHHVAGHSKEVETELLALSTILERTEEFDEQFSESAFRASSQAGRIVELATRYGIELTHDSNCVAYGSYDVDGHRETHALRTRRFRLHLRRLMHDADCGAPSEQSIQDAMNTLEAHAVHSGEMTTIHRRFAPDGRGGICVDLGDEKWRMVHVTAAGWTTLERSSVNFIRSTFMRALPEPTSGGNILRLRKYVNLPHDGDFYLFLGWLVHCFWTDGGFAILDLAGEQGSGKSTAARVARRLVDPRHPPLASPPREERDLIAVANASAVVAYDNLSRIPGWLADALSRMATGGGQETRQLYSDADTFAVDVTRPVLITGIPEIASAPDLADRSITLWFEQMKHERQSERRFWSEFDDDAPALFGALLDLIGQTIALVSQVAEHGLPRMADFGLRGEAMARAMDKEPGWFLRVVAENRMGQHAIIIEASPVGRGILTLMKDRTRWQGTATNLKNELMGLDQIARDRELSHSVRELSGQLRYIAPVLRASGINVVFERARTAKRDRLITLERIESSASEPSEPYMRLLAPDCSEAHLQ